MYSVYLFPRTEPRSLGKYECMLSVSVGGDAKKIIELIGEFCSPTVPSYLPLFLCSPPSSRGLLLAYCIWICVLTARD